MDIFKADLHIHTCLSPCADLDMSPRKVVEKSIESGIDFIAVCDHNSVENVGAVLEAASSKGLFVIPGMEINSREEVHCLALFESLEQAKAMQDIVYSNLKGENSPEIFGEQVVANEFDEVLSFNNRLLIGSTEMTLENIIREVHGLGGVGIASHVDRPSYSILSQLGFIPEDLELDGLEISRRMDMESARKQLPDITGYPLITSSDAHFLGDIGSVFTRFIIEKPGLDEVQMALKGDAGRRVLFH